MNIFAEFLVFTYAVSKRKQNLASSPDENIANAHMDCMHASALFKYPTKQVFFCLKCFFRALW